MFGYLRRNIGLKVFAFVLAYMVWLHVAGSGHQIRDLELPIDIQPSAATIVSSYTPSTVKLRVRGPESQMSRLNADRLFVRLDLRDVVEPGSHELDVTRDDVSNLPRGITIDDIITNSIRIRLERRIEKSLRVTPRIVGEPASGFSIYAVETDPIDVLVRGPESTLSSLDSVATARVDVEGKRESGRATVRIERPSPSRHVEFPDGDEVIVSFEILDEAAPVTWRVAVPAPAGMTLAPAEVAITVEAPPSQIEYLKPRIAVRLDDERLSSRGGTARVRVDLSALDEGDRRRIRLVRIEPGQVRVRPAAR